MKILGINEYFGNDYPETMYRNDKYGTGVTDVIDIMTHEIGDLKNTDIIEWCLGHYGVSENLSAILNDIIENIDDYDENDFVLKRACASLIDEISRRKGKRIRYGIWLADRETVMELYDGEGGIDEYYTSDVVLSDLGGDGVLFGYPDPPVKK